MDPSIPLQWTEPNATNGSSQSSFPSCDDTLTLDLLILVIALVGLVGNTTVLWLLGFHVRRNAISVYILNLAVADLLILWCLILLSVLDAISFAHHFPVFKPFIIVNVAMIPYTAGLSMLSAISTERCISVLWPIWYRCHRPIHMSAAMCALLWTLSLIVNVLEWYNTGFLTQFFDGDWWKQVDVIIAAWLVILFVTLSGSSLILLVKILCGSHRVPLTRLCVTIMVTVLTFAICSLPFGIYSFLLSWLQLPFRDVFCNFFPVVLIMSCLNSSVNPIIYFLIGSARQKKCLTLKLVLQRALQDTPEREECGSSLPQDTLEMSGSRVEQ